MSAPPSNRAAARTDERRDRLIPWYFVMAFMVVVLVNGLFIYMATSTHRGVVTPNAYQKGIHYNDTVNAVEQQQALGWKVQLAYDGALLHVGATNAADQPLVGARVSAHIARPVESGYEQTVTLPAIAGNSSGGYAAPVTFPMHGQWDITVIVVWNQQSFQYRERIILQ